MEGQTKDFNQLIHEGLQEMEFGQLQLTLKVHRGGLHKVDMARNRSVKVEGTNPDADALGIIISQMKIQQERGGDGQLGFVVMYRKNKPVQVQIQEFVPEQVM